PGQHSGCQRHARQDSNLSLPRLLEKQIGGTLAKDVEDDLHCLHVGIFNRLQCFFDSFDAHAVVANLALLDELIQRLEQLRIVINFCRRTMQLQQLECISLQILQTAIDKGLQVVSVVSGGDVWIESPSSFGRDDYLFAAFALKLRQQPLTTAVAIHIGGVEKVDTQIHGQVQRRERFAIVNVAPEAAYSPGAKTDL